ncbi:ADP-ribosylglycohydrolase family protein [Streptomyces sp. GMY02]|uniref:ADP-ribosylglycohydrolase family protein n=1 Tax=Streptomyces sp. GMY02 TaxID=1333528 RepID=UPI0026652CCC|nr:ADP-ribosylglycohydrolase family protein [Streptomyces sp. GMY02]
MRPLAAGGSPGSACRYCRAAVEAARIACADEASSAGSRCGRRLGGDTDTVAAVTGGLAGAYYGLDAIPARWTEPLHVPLPGFDGRVLRSADLLRLAHRLGG